MTFARRAPTVIIGFVVVVVAFMSFASNMISHRMAASFEEGRFALMGSIVQSKLDEAEAKAIAAAEIVAAMPSVKDAFAARDKQELLRVTQDAFAVQKEKYGISQAQFHIAPAESFLRVHNPSRPPEDLSHYRQIVVEVNRALAIRKGIEVTTSGIGVFGTLPMTDSAGKPTGSFEMALEIGGLLDELKKSYGFELALLVDEKILRETATSLKGEVFNDQNRVGKFLNFYSTHTDLLRSLVAGEDVNVIDDSHYIRDSNGKPYGVLVQPVYNYAEKQFGVLVIASDFSDTRSADGQAMVWQIALGIVSVVVLIGVVLTTIRGVLLQPLAVVGSRFEALADGDASQPIEKDVKACDEIERLATSYERLRARIATEQTGEPS